jgi:hypothetical protein
MNESGVVWGVEGQSGGDGRADGGFACGRGWGGISHLLVTDRVQAWYKQRCKCQFWSGQRCDDSTRGRRRQARMGGSRHG